MISVASLNAREKRDFTHCSHVTHINTNGTMSMCARKYELNFITTLFVIISPEQKSSCCESYSHAEAKRQTRCVTKNLAKHNFISPMNIECILSLFYSSFSLYLFLPFSLYLSFFSAHFPPSISPSQFLYLSICNCQIIFHSFFEICVLVKFDVFSPILSLSFSLASIEYT